MYILNLKRTFLTLKRMFLASECNLSFANFVTFLKNKTSILKKNLKQFQCNIFYKFKNFKTGRDSNFTKLRNMELAAGP